MQPAAATTDRMCAVVRPCLHAAGGRYHRPNVCDMVRPCLHAAGGRYHPGFILCDPHAVRAVPVLLPESAYANAAKMPPKLDLARPVVLASLSAFVQVRGVRACACVSHFKCAKAHVCCMCV